MSFSFSISPIVTDIKPSGIRKFFDLVGEMDGAISLGIGEPDFVTPWHIRDAGISSLEKGQTYYTANAGLMPLRKEICNYFERRFHLSYNEKNVLVTVGGSEAIDLCIRALITEGDEVLIPEPSFVCYEPCVRLAHGTPVPIVTEEKDGFILTPEKLKEKITPRTKLLVLPFPNNPTGAIMTKGQLQAIADVLKDTNIAVLSDEIYAELTYSEKHCSIANIDGMKERTVIVSGFSKSYAMTGWRVGFLAAHPDLIKKISSMQGHSTSNICSIAQKAALAALTGPMDGVREMCRAFQRRRDLAMHIIEDWPFAVCPRPDGAFYLFVDVRKCFGRLAANSTDICTRLLDKAHVAVVPGAAFGDDNCIRFSYAVADDVLAKALDRIGAELAVLAEAAQN